MTTSPPPPSDRPPTGLLRRGARALRASGLFLVLLVLLSGVLYPGVVTLFAQTVTPATANGSIITGANGTAVASALLGQNITNASLFWLRPSQIDYQPYTGAGSEAPLGPSDPALVNQTLGFIRQYGLSSLTAPIALTSDSASGLDPDITLGGALVQVPRIAGNTTYSAEELRAFVNAETVAPGLGIFGPPYVNVVQLDLILIHDLAVHARLPGS